MALPGPPERYPTRGTRPLITLAPGRVLVVGRPCVVRTVLGSCVAVILFVPRLRVSAICHAQLPEKPFGEACLECGPGQAADVEAGEHKFVTCSLRSMLNALYRRGAAKWELLAKVYGGAHVVPAIEARHSVAEDNLRIVQTLLDREGIRIVYSDIGGLRGRTIEHETDTNLTKVRVHGDPP
jgi:chemotaxis protein CheD